MSSKTDTNSDPRVDYIQNVVLGSCNIKIGTLSPSIFQDNEVFEFLDNLDCKRLKVTVRNDNGTVVVDFSTRISSSKDNNNGTTTSGVQFVKRNAEPLTDANITDNILISTFGRTQNTLQNLYINLHSLYLPSLLESGGENVDPQLGELLAQLDKRLASAVRSNDDDKEEEDNFTSINSVEDEYEYWSSKASRSRRGPAGKFRDYFETVGSKFSSLNELKFAEVIDLLEDTHNCLDDVWKEDVDSDDQYPQERMKHLFGVIASSIGQFVQKKIGKINVWNGPFTQVRGALLQAVRLCEKWNRTTKDLTGKYWAGSDEHPWKDDVYEDEYLKNFSKRVEQVGRLRSMHEELLRLLSSSDRRQLDVDNMFKPFEGKKPLHYSAYTDAKWQRAVKAYEELLAPVERHIAGNFRKQIQSMSDQPQQLLREFARYKQLLRRPNIAQALQSERETLLVRLLTHLEQIEEDFENRSSAVDVYRGSNNRNSNGRNQPPTGKNTSFCVNNVVWGKQLRNKVKYTLKAVSTMFSDLDSFEEFKDRAEALHDKLEKWVKDQVRDWQEKIEDQLNNDELSVQVSGRLMEIHHDSGNMIVNYSESLAELLRDTRQLSGLGYAIPKAIQRAVKDGEKYFRYAVQLKKVANFINTMESQIIPSQKKMLLQSLLDFDECVKGRGNKNGNDVTWSEPGECERYVGQLQKSADNLSRENRRLRHAHLRMVDATLALMNTDILRQKERWKKRWNDLWEMGGNVGKSYSKDHLDKWYLHWDHQVYKALEAGYRFGLESLSEFLPDIKCELVFSGRQLQFRPAVEELRTKYYKEMKKFINMPNAFEGFGNKDVYKKMPDLNSSSLIHVYEKAEVLFKRLLALKKSLNSWVYLGCVPDIFEFVETRVTTVPEWEVNFKMLKQRRQMLDKLSDFHKIDCISVSATPFKAAVQDHLQNFGDALLVSLRKSILSTLTTVETFLNESMSFLGELPQTIEEIGQAKKEWQRIVEERGDIKSSIKRCNEMKRLLAGQSGAAGTIDIAEVTQRLAQLPSQWENFDIAVEAFNDILEEAKNKMKEDMERQVIELNQEIAKFKIRWDAQKPQEMKEWDRNAISRVFETLGEKRTEFDELKTKTTKHAENCEQFQMSPPKFNELEGLEEDIDMVTGSWNMYKEYLEKLDEMGKQDWIIFRAKLFELHDFVKAWSTKIKERSKQGIIDIIDEHIDEEISLFKKALPALKFMRGEPYKDDHWQELFQKLKIKGVKNYSTDLKVQHFFDSIKLVIKNGRFAKEMTARAQGEVTIREALLEIKAWARAAEVKMMEHEELGRRTPLICEWKELFTSLGDNQSLLQSLKDSPYYKAFADEGSTYEQKFALLDEVLHAINSIQRKWVYLEPIFGRGALPQEQGRFKKVDEDFRDILIRLEGDKTIFSLADDSIYSRIRENVQQMLSQLERCQKALADFLEEKRSAMPRFYFIGDDDLLEILGQAQNPAVIQAHLKKLFQGVHKVEFTADKKFVTALMDVQGEVVKLDRDVEITENVEVWLKNLSYQMKDTLKSILVRCSKENLDAIGSILPTYPGQILLVSAQINFAIDVEGAIRSGSLMKLKERYNKRLTAYTAMDLSREKLLQTKKKNLVIELIHMIDVIDMLHKEGVTSTGSWLWQKQLRWCIPSGTNECVVKMVDATFKYTYEYQGNFIKLCHTPLTDKCYLTMTQGMKMGFGGNPYGPAGTGKTESVKALGGCLGRQVLVFNCDEGIDFESMGRIFTGLVKCGAWGCFDEFNRLKEDQLSAVSQQIQVIQSAIKNKTSSIQLLGKNIDDVDHNAGIFVTMNPAGKKYGGRSKLPENLKNLFRPVAMSKPDNPIIAEAMLVAEGFAGAKDIAHKLCELYGLSKKLLSDQQHYDWGLRAMKAVLNTAGKLLQSAKAESGSQLSLRVETELLIKSVRVNTLSKLTFSDAIGFLGLITDVFPGLSSEDIRYERLELAMKEVMTNKPYNLKFDEGQVRKMIQLKESLEQRMGCMIVGPSGCGKTSLWRILRDSLQKVGEKIKIYVMNPKSMPRDRLLGHMDMDTREWFDGVLTDAARKVVKEPMDVRSWIVCDGDVDPVWIESLNTVLDDNHLLTMPNGERISFGSNVNFLFESHNLIYASPATISRNGMIYLSDEDVDVKRLVFSWLNNLPKEKQSTLNVFVKDFFYQALDWVLQDGMSMMVVETTMVGTVTTGLSHLAECNTVQEFLCGLVRGLGGNLGMEDRERFTKEIFGWAGERLPDLSAPLDCYADGSVLGCYASETHLEGELDENPVLRTVSVQRNMDIIKGWVDRMEPFILVGPEGAGKNMLLMYALSKQRSTTVTTLHCNAQTTAENVVQRIQQACVEQHSNNGRVLRPRSGDRLVLYLKDINLPKPDKYDTCMLIAFLQQLITFKGFYNENLEFVTLERIHIVCSMNPATTVGRHPLSTRFTAIAHIAYIDYPKKDELVSIYSSFLEKAFETRELAESRFKSPKEAKKLADTMVELFSQVKSKFSVDDHRHYLFTPRHLTAWVLGLLRYDLASEDLLDVVSYEAQRLFRDRLVDEQSEGKFDSMLNSLIKSRWSKAPDIKNQYFTSLMNASSVGGSGGQKEQEGKNDDDEMGGGPKKDIGPMLSRIDYNGFSEIVKNGLELYERDERELNILLFKEVLDNIARVDRTLSKIGGSLLLVGRSGVGRRTATSLVAHMHGMEFKMLDITDEYSTKILHLQLKSILQVAGIDGVGVVFYVEDHHIHILNDVLETINSLLSSGEVPGLYMHEELEPLLAPLREQMMQVDGYFRTPYDYFLHQIKKNLHVVLGMDSVNPSFGVRCESNPALFTRCEVIWMGEWNSGSMAELPPLLLPDKFSADGSLGEYAAEALRKSAINIHRTTEEWQSTPLDFVVFLKTFESLYAKKHGALLTDIKHLQSGLSKLEEASETVDKLSAEAKEQQKELKVKQDMADKAMDKITDTLESASDRRKEVEVLRKDMEVEQKNTENKKADIEVELSEVKPILEEAKTAVGNIRSDNLNEIRSLKMPPEAIHDVLSAVLMLLGIKDTSWLSMRRFLQQRGVKENILNYDAHNLTPSLRKQVSKLLRAKANSFEDKVIRRVSVAAAPLASWVKANVRYSLVLEKILPLEQELEEATHALQRSATRLDECQHELDTIDDRVKELKNVFKEKTREAEILKTHLEKTMETLDKANNLIGKLSGEKQRWDDQVQELKQIEETLPSRVLIAAGFNTYLAKKPEDVRDKMTKTWTGLCDVDPKSFDYRRLLSSESEQLVWKAAGLPADALSMENAIVILNEHHRVPFIIDPAMTATNWMKQQLANPEFTKRPLEVLNRADPRFTLQVELAVRFGKILFINEVDTVDPMLYPLLRRDLRHQGPRFVVQVGDKTVDYEENFRLYISTRNPEPYIPPDASALITEVNFTVTRSGLEGQLLGVTIKHEQPELEAKKSKLLAEEESYKVELANLEKNLLETLAESEGNLLENTELIDQLTKTKTTAADVKERMAESARASEIVDEQREVFRPFAKDGSKMFFAIQALQSCNHMYQFSLNSFLDRFRDTLKEPMDAKGGKEGRVSKLTPALEKRVLYDVGRSLFKADRLMWGLHLVRAMYPHMYGDNEWELFTGDIVSGIDEGKSGEGKSSGGSRNMPTWASSSRSQAFSLLETTFPRFVSGLNLSDTSLWGKWSRSQECEKDFPRKLNKNKLSPFQKILLTQALRPDRLQSQMNQFVCEVLDVTSVAPPPTGLMKIFQEESKSTTPILLVTSAGADPSKELEDLARDTVGMDHYEEVAMGGGQQSRATKMLHDCARAGDWLCLKNLHLVTAWLPTLEKEISTLKPADGFRLWLTTEAHHNFPPILLQISQKLTFESPPGLKKNLQRTYASWSNEYISKGSVERAQLLFVLAWFHALVQERRTYMPQGWVKFYEFSLGDLRAGTEVIDMVTSQGKNIDWETVVGLMENAIYGGRVDNIYDFKVLVVYLKQYFNGDILRGGGKGRAADRGFRMPNASTNKADYDNLIENLDDDDSPSFFGLPQNVERSVQRAQSSMVVAQLKSLSLSTSSSNKFDREQWRKVLGPMCKLWDKLTRSNKSVLSRPGEDREKVKDPTKVKPVKQFIKNENQFAFKLMTVVDNAMRSINKVLWESGLLTPEIQTNAAQLLSGCVPRQWENMWEGPEKPQVWLRSLALKKISLAQWSKQYGASGDIAGEKLNLSELFNPGTFLMALRQQTSREGNMRMDSLKLRSSFGTDLDNATIPVKLTGMLLQGSAFTGKRLEEADADAAEVVSIQECTIAFDLVKEDERQLGGSFKIPIYFSTTRERLLTEVSVSVGNADPEDFVVNGSALFLGE